MEKGNPNAKSVQRIRDNRQAFRHHTPYGKLLYNPGVLLGHRPRYIFFPSYRPVTVIASVVMTVLIVMFGEITPKTFAACNTSKVALMVARPMEFIISLMHPIVWVFTSVTNAIIRLLGGKVEKSPFVTEDEIKAIISIGQEEGALDVEEKAMLHKVFEFGDTLALEAMRPRTKIVSIPNDAKVSEVLSLVAEHGHSRYPVIEESVDAVQGVLYVKDLVIALSRGELDENDTIKRMVRAAYFIPETKRVRELLTEMQDQKIQMVIVIDEYGGTAGLITLEDLLEEIVGSIHDEFDREESEVQIVDEKNFVVSGAADLDEVSKETGINIKSKDFNTIGGFVFGLFGRMPHPGETLKYKELKFEVLEMDERKIGSVKITKP